jgi:endonuclease G
MAPNYAIASRYGEDAQLQTFLMSNIVPQAPRLNQQTWRLIEERIANDYTRSYGDVWVTVGPLYEQPVERLPSGVAIPSAFFKVIIAYDADQPKGLAFIVPQTVTGREPFNQFLTSIDQVEALSGFDFFWELEDDFEEFFEAFSALELW